MFFLLFEATPRSFHPNADSVAGAFVDCWIDAPTLSKAERTARKMIEAQGWIVGELEEGYEVDRSSYENESAGLPYYEQALLDKEVLVFHTYPVDEEGDANE